MIKIVFWRFFVGIGNDISHRIKKYCFWTPNSDLKILRRPFWMRVLMALNIGYKDRLSQGSSYLSVVILHILWVMPYGCLGYPHYSWSVAYGKFIACTAPHCICRVWHCQRTAPQSLKPLLHCNPKVCVADTCLVQCAPHSALAAIEWICRYRLLNYSEK